MGLNRMRPRHESRARLIRVVAQNRGRKVPEDADDGVKSTVLESLWSRNDV
jgi:hypothetical protein